MGSKRCRDSFKPQTLQGNTDCAMPASLGTDEGGGQALSTSTEHDRPCPDSTT